MLVRRLRLCTGLILAAFIISHFINHSLGLLSLEAMESGRLSLRCPLFPCRITRPIPDLCQAVWKNCPSCEGRSQCPPYYHIFFEGLHEEWTVSLHAGDGTAVAHELVSDGVKSILSFRPSEEFMVDGVIGNYYLAFELKNAEKLGVSYSIKTKLAASDGPYCKKE